MNNCGTHELGTLTASVRLVLALAAVLCAALLPATAHGAFVSPELEQRALASPDARYSVIVQGARGRSSAEVAAAVRAQVAATPGDVRGVKRGFVSLNGVAAELTGEQIQRLSLRGDVFAISEDVPVRPTALSNKQRWPFVSGTAKSWSGVTNGSLQAPTIAVVDSGVEAARADFAGRLLESVVLTQRTPNAPGDGRGHGTFVASIAAGSGAGYAGAMPNANLVSIDVIDDTGAGSTSDVIAACDYILRNKARLGIRVANFSLNSSQRSSFRFDPLNKAVEKLWFSGVVVVAASGNYAQTEKGVLYSPANDPFVITVGAQDIGGNVSVNNDFAAPWSSFGYTLDGFAKPDLGAPGRYMVGAVPGDSTLARERPDRLVEPGYLQMSGTSFAAPVVAGAAAYILAVHPDYTPDQVKGALLLTARHTPLSVPMSSGRGEVDAAKAVDVLDPPNPNLSLNRYLVADPAGSSVPVFDEATWTSNAKLNPAWDAATWTSATWTSATWTSATWTSATWTSATWTSAAWEAATWTSATWTSATWTSDAGASATWTSQSDATWTSNAEVEGSADGEYLAPEEQAQVEAELGITLTP